MRKFYPQPQDTCSVLTGEKDVREQGIIVSTSGPTAKVQFVKGKQCEGCHLCDAFGEGSGELIAHNGIGACPGDCVEVEIPPRDLVSHSFMVFIVPVLAMIAGYFLAHDFVAATNGAGVAGAFAGLALSLILLHIYDRRISSRNNCVASIVGIIMKNCLAEN